MDIFLGLQLSFQRISRDDRNVRHGHGLPNGEFACRRAAKSSPTVSLVLASKCRCRHRGSATKASLCVKVGPESISIGSNGAPVLSIETLLASTSFRFAISLSDPDSERLKRGGREESSQGL